MSAPWTVSSPAMMSAFPVHCSVSDCEIDWPGMTLRDYFAATVAAAHVTMTVYLGSPDAIKAFAARSYEIADAMLLAREVTP